MQFTFLVPAASFPSLPKQASCSHAVRSVRGFSLSTRHSLPPLSSWQAGLIFGGAISMGCTHAHHSPLISLLPRSLREGGVAEWGWWVSIAELQEAGIFRLVVSELGGVQISSGRAARSRPALSAGRAGLRKRESKVGRRRAPMAR